MVFLIQHCGLTTNGTQRLTTGKALKLPNGMVLRLTTGWDLRLITGGSERFITGWFLGIFVRYLRLTADFYTIINPAIRDIVEASFT